MWRHPDEEVASQSAAAKQRTLPSCKDANPSLVIHSRTPPYYGGRKLMSEDLPTILDVDSPQE